jgi:DNA-binding response OmpR family regulator
MPPAREPRPQVLVADDQTEVAQTLATLLRGLNVRAHFSSDGEDAYRQCVDRRFDLLIIDLQMPPGRWGGLWLIRKLREDGYLIPILVLSGAAGQTQTIEALRLSADDFVIKDHAQQELSDRVAELLTHSRDDVRRLAGSRLPAPVAVPAARTQGTDSAPQRLRLTLFALESALRFTCLLGLAEARARAEVSGSAELAIAGFMPRLARPAMGTWESLRNLIMRAMPDSVAAGWARLFDSALTGEAIAIRNNLAHVSEPSDAQAEVLLRTVDMALDQFLQPMVQRPEPRLIRADQLSFDGNGYHVSGHALQGIGTAAPRARLRSPSAVVVSGHVYLWGNAPVDLHPLVRAEPGEDFGMWDIFVLEGIEMSRNQTPLDGSESLCYLNLRRGIRLTSPSLTTADILPPTVPT